MEKIVELRRKRMLLARAGKIKEAQEARDKMLSIFRKEEQKVPEKTRTKKIKKTSKKRKYKRK